MVILSQACKPDNFESYHSLNLSFMNIQGLRLNSVDCESFLESNSPDILALYETNLDEWIDSGNFSVRGYLPLIQKDSSTHPLSCSLYEGRTSFCTGFISRKLCRFLLFLIGFTSLSVLLFFLYQSPSLSLCTVFDYISSNIDEVLSINPSANIFIFGDFNIHHKDWLTYFGGTDRSVGFNAGKTQLVSFDRFNNTGSIDVKMGGSVPEEKSSF